MLSKATASFCLSTRIHSPAHPSTPAEITVQLEVRPRADGLSPEFRPVKIGLPFG
jgi:hypothetical protein